MVPLGKAALTKELGTKAGAVKLGLSQNNRRVCACLDTHKVDDKYGGLLGCWGRWLAGMLAGCWH